MRERVVTYYLQMLHPAELRPARLDRSDLEVARVTEPSPQLNRSLYRDVGRGWHWVDRLKWKEAQWRRYVEHPRIETWVLRVAGALAGYFELARADDKSVELAYFGLLPQFIGQGLGGPLLTCALERAWATGATRVWVHTCTLDHPVALRNYQARGMSIYKQETKETELPETGQP